MKNGLKLSFKMQYILFIILVMLLLFYTCKSEPVIEEQTDYNEEDFIDEEITEEDNLLFPTIALNQIGFFKSQPDKQIVISIPTETARPATCYIEELKSGKWSRKPEKKQTQKPVFWEMSGRYEAILSIDDLEQGTYRIYVPVQNGIRKEIFSYDFMISTSIEKLYKKVRDHALGAFYYWFANEGGKFPDAHWQDEEAVIMELKNGVLVPSGQTMDVRGGLYDAGDYGKYVVNGAVSSGFLMTAYELLPAAFAFNVTTENSTFTLLDLIKREVSWIASMQDKSGGFHHKIATANWSPNILPDQESTTRYILPVTTNATAGGGAALAQAARIFKDKDPVFSNTMLEAAQKAWNYLQHREFSICQKSYDSDLDSDGEIDGSFEYGGAYADNYVLDEKLWLAVELYGATGNVKYKDFINQNLGQIGTDFLNFNSINYDWRSINYMCIYSLYNIAKNNNNLKLTELLEKEYIIPAADKLIALQREQIYPYICGGPDGLLAWGSNYLAVNFAIELLISSTLADDIQKAAAYKNGALKTLHYILGFNPLAFSFITGIGDDYARNPHWRYSLAAEHTPPGFLVGGPNSKTQSGDPVLSEVQHLAPLLKYKDQGRGRGYAVNEVAINWNASLVVFTSYIIHLFP
jgi:endoglucanase